VKLGGNIENPLCTERREPRIWGYCERCKCDIWVGERYYEVDGDIVCSDCAPEDAEEKIAEEEE
jgi:hypothetical protein